MIETILQRQEFQIKPPVLIDIGASGEIHSKWQSLAKHSICIAFDADDREMGFTESNNTGFKKLITINRIVTDKQIEETDFYLTDSPFCSSTLEPDLAKLADWPFLELFKVQKKIKLKTIRLSEALKNSQIQYIDWLKVDTQGTDLRLFKSIPEEIKTKVLVAEFEPGIIDAYKGEDKLFEVIDYMTSSDFFMSSIEIKGVQRISAQTIKKYNLDKKTFRGTQRISPGWGEVCYMNKLKSTEVDLRTYLLAYVFAVIEQQFGYALEIAEQAASKFDDPVLYKMKRYALTRISRNQLKWPFFAVKNKLNKVFNLVFG